jgi:hypothetical protein
MANSIQHILFTFIIILFRPFGLILLFHYLAFQSFHNITLAENVTLGCANKKKFLMTLGNTIDWV